MFVWTVDDVITVILIGFLVILTLVFVFMYSIRLLISWFSGWKSYKDSERCEDGKWGRGMTEKGTPFEIIGTTVIWIKDTLTVVFEPQESEE